MTPVLKGLKVGDFKVIRFIGGQNEKWECECKCGNIVNVNEETLLNPEAKHMCRQCIDREQSKPKTDLTGKQIGHVTVQKYTGKSLWECKCSCGKIIKVKTFNLTTAINEGNDYSCTECLKQRKMISKSGESTDLLGKTINKWKVLEYKGKGMYK